MLQEIVAGALPSGAAVAADDHRVDDVKVMITMNIIMTLIMAMVLVMVVLRCASVGSAIFSLISVFFLSAALPCRIRLRQTQQRFRRIR